MLNKNRFKAKYIERGLKAADVARLMRISSTTLYRKTSGESDFTRKEIQLFRSALGLTADEVVDIFFLDLVDAEGKAPRHARQNDQNAAV